MLRKSALALAAILPLAAHAQNVVVPFQNGQVLTGSQLKIMQKGLVATKNGAATGLSVTGGSLDGTTTIAGTVASVALQGILTTAQMFGSSSIDWAPVIQKAIKFVEATGGGIVRLPAGSYIVASPIAITTSGTELRGDGYGTNLIDQDATDNLITVSGCTRCGVRSLRITGNVAFSGAPYAIVLGAGKYHAFVYDVMLQYMFNGISVSGGGEESRVQKIVMRNMMGTKGVYFMGASGAAEYRLAADDLNLDNPTQVTSQVPTFSAWAASTAYSLGQEVFSPTQGIYYICSTAGTSGSSEPTIAAGSSGTDGSVTWTATATPGYQWSPGRLYKVGDQVTTDSGIVYLAATAGVSGTTEPSGWGGNGAGAAAFQTTVSDGGVSWYPNTGQMHWIWMDSYANTLAASNVTLLGGANAVTVADTANTGSSAPEFVVGNDVEMDHNFFGAFNATAGSGFQLHHFFSSALHGYAFTFGPTTARIMIDGGILDYNGAGGIFLKSDGNGHGPTGFTLTGTQIQSNCGYAAMGGNAWQCSSLFVGDGTSGLIATGNTFGVGSSTAENYNVLFDSGTHSTQNLVTGNNLLGAATATTQDNNTGDYNTITNNMTPAGYK